MHIVLKHFLYPIYCLHNMAINVSTEKQRENRFSKNIYQYPTLNKLSK
jgi:hypothetical protein